jgi:hypothetical protein
VKLINSAWTLHFTRHLILSGPLLGDEGATKPLLNRAYNAAYNSLLQAVKNSRQE